MKHKSQTLDIDIDKIADKIMQLKPLWVKRPSEFIFYTLGPCAYLDGTKPEYKRDLKLINPILKEEFGDLYKKISEYLKQILGEEVTLNDDLAHPSFHIIFSNEYAVYNGGNWHIDTPQVTAGYPDHKQITFTVAIKLPFGGGGIDYTEDQRTAQYLPYKEKEIIVHDGLTMHRIAPMQKHIPGDVRITMQGHVIRINGKLNMFW